MPSRRLLTALLLWTGGCSSAPQLDTPALARILELQDRRVTAVDELTEHLRAPARWTRRFAARALGVSATRAAVAPLALALARDQDVEVRREAAAALGRCDPEAPPLRAALGDQDAEVRRIAASALTGQPAATALLTALADPSPAVRATAAGRLTQLVGHDPTVGAALLDAWQRETDPTAQFGLLSALAQSQRPSLAPLFAAVVAAPDAAPELLAVALTALADCGRDPAARARLQQPTDLAAVGHRLTHPDPRVAGTAALALAALAPGDPRSQQAAFAALRELLARASRTQQIAALGRAAATLAPTTAQRDDLASALALGANRGDTAMRVAHLRALADLAPGRAVEIARRLLDAAPWLQAAATEVIATHADAGLAVRADIARSPLHASAALRSLIQTHRAPPLLAAIHAAEPGLVELIPDLLTAALRHIDPAELLWTMAHMPGDDLTRALAALAAWHAHSEDDAGARPWASLRQDGSALVARALPGSDLPPWPSSAAPPPFSPFFSLLGRSLTLELRTSRGKITLAFDPAAAPIHVFALLRQLESGGPWRNLVVHSGAERVQFGNPLDPRPDPQRLLRREPNRTTSLAPGLVGFVPLPLADLDGPDLFITRSGSLAGVTGCTVVGRVVGGMGTVESLEIGDRILHISWRTESN